MKIADIDRIFVMNLNRRPDRWDEFQKAWAATGISLPLTRFAACDGRDYKPPASWDVGNAAYGCYLTHTSILSEAIRTGVEHFVIFEDDAVFAEGFAASLEEVLADLPVDYDQLYLGWQALHTERVPPSRITEHLGRCGNCNRSHATLWSRRGAIRILQRLQDLGERKSKHHLDHWLGELHEELDQYGEHVYQCYIAIPQLVFQAAGQSDICGKQTPLNTWLYRGNYRKETPSLIDVLSFQTAFGRLGRRGWLGYEGRRSDLSDDERTTVISLHAPSTLHVAVREPVKVVGLMNSTGGTREQVQVDVDGVNLGIIAAAHDRSAEYFLNEGEHCLEFRINKNLNAFAHTLWCFTR